MSTLEEVKQMQQQGLTEESIISQLREKGVSYKDIAEALSQTKIKAAVEEPITDPQSPQAQAMQTSPNTSQTPPPQSASQLPPPTQAPMPPTTQNSSSQLPTLPQIPNQPAPQVPEQSPPQNPTTPPTSTIQQLSSSEATPQLPLPTQAPMPSPTQNTNAQLPELPKSAPIPPSTNQSESPGPKPGMQHSMMQQSPSEMAPQQELQAPTPSDQFSDSEQTSGEYDEQDQGYDQEYDNYDQGYDDQYSGAISPDTISEISEQIVAEKMSGMRKHLESILDSRTIIETKIESIDERLRRIEKTIDALQSSVLKKVGDYITNIGDIKKELLETQKSFGKIVHSRKHSAQKKSSTKKSSSKKTTKKK